MQKLRLILFYFLSSCMMIPAYSCSRDSLYDFELELDLSDTLSYVEINNPPYSDWSLTKQISIGKFTSLGFSHQSAARYRDYAFFVSKGRSRIGLFNLAEKKMVYTLNLKAVNGDTYHCNQCTFGVEKYEETDYFPLLYISQRAKSDERCFIEVYRVFPLYNEDLSEFDSFYIELIQTIYLPRMSSNNSLGNANCVIDASSNTMYTYSRNNNKKDENYNLCKITQFAIPDVHQKTVIINDEAILSSFMIEASAIYMQGGCIHDRVLYIGQGSLSVGYIYLNIIDLDKQELVRRFDLRDCKVTWEPEGCFYYDDCVMLAYSGAVCRVEKQ